MWTVEHKRDWQEMVVYEGLAGNPCLSDVNAYLAKGWHVKEFKIIEFKAVFVLWKPKG